MQTVGEIAGYVAEQVASLAVRPAGAVEQEQEAGGSDGDDEDGLGEGPGAGRQGRRTRRKSSARSDAEAEGDDGRPSQLLKMLRPPPPPRPLFLAAPGVANAQSGSLLPLFASALATAHRGALTMAASSVTLS